MNPAEFDNIARAERDFWRYRGMREMLYRLLTRAALKPAASVLEAGCGTGYMSKLLAERYGRHSEFVQERQRFTRRRLVEAVEAAGFRVERATYLNCLLLPVSLARGKLSAVPDGDRKEALTGKDAAFADLLVDRSPTLGRIAIER